MTATAFKPRAQTPLAVIPRDNMGFHNRDILPECARAAPYTHLVLFASPSPFNRNGVAIHPFVASGRAA